MSLTYNNVDPTTINYKGTDITVVKYGTTAVWGKHYSLSISAGSNTTITVNRTSSPNQHASTGNLSNGATIYYGDTLTISYTVSSGYNISTHTVNGTTFTSGTSYTVSSNISVITTAVAVASWHTVWTGNKSTYVENYNSSFSVSDLSGLSVSSDTTKIRISGSFHVYDEYDWDSTISFTNMTDGALVPVYPNSYTYKTSSYTGWIYIKTTNISSSNTINFSKNTIASDGTYLNYFYITKIEQYY